MTGFTFVLVIQLTLGVLFLVSSLPKLHHPKVFALAVFGYKILPARLALLYASCVPAIEFFVGFSLITNTVVAFSSVAASLLLSTFLVGIGANLLRGRNPSCGCFGHSNSRISWSLFLRDVGLLLMAIVLVIERILKVTPTSISPYNMIVKSSDSTSMFAFALCLVITTMMVIALPRTRPLIKKASYSAPLH